MTDFCFYNQYISYISQLPTTVTLPVTKGAVRESLRL